jgi:hypothetical protein
MKEIDITDQIFKLYKSESKKNLELVKEVEVELENEIPKELQFELDQLLAKGQELNKEKSKKGNVLTFPKVIRTIGETQLLAAAGQTLSSWFSQPIIFGGAGFILDVRKIIGSDEEVDIYLAPSLGEPGAMKNTFADCLGQSIDIMVSTNAEALLSATLYVDNEGNAAAGQGRLISPKEAGSIKGRITIDIIVKE